MIRIRDNRTGERRNFLPRIVLTALALSLPAAGCSDLLEVEDPSVANPATLEGRDGLPALHAGAVGDFQVAFGGNSTYEGYVNLVGLFTDEMHHTETFPDRLKIDARKIDPREGTQLDNYRMLHRARASAERAIKAFDAHGDPASDATRWAEVLALGGYTYTLFGEIFCSGVPFSEVDASGAPNYGPAETTEQTYQRAIARFDDAIALTNAHKDIIHLAKVGKARVLANMGNFSAAAALANDVPTDFVYEIEHSDNSGRQNNGVFIFQTNSRRWGVSEKEGTNGLPFRSAADPRVPVATQARAGFDNTSAMYDQLKYPDRNASIVLASGIEARLIEAEAALKASDVPGWLGILNDLRATVDGLDPLTDPGSDAARVDLHYQERAFWLFLTAHRLGDMRRLVTAWSKDPNTVYPIGSNPKGEPYGDDYAFPIPVDERNNPEYNKTYNASLKGCLSLAP